MTTVLITHLGGLSKIGIPTPTHPFQENGKQKQTQLMYNN